jgi:hypothetical protein
MFDSGNEVISLLANIPGYTSNHLHEARAKTNLVSLKQNSHSRAKIYPKIYSAHPNISYQNET